MSHDVALRRARDDDSEGVIALIAAVFAEYPGCVLDVDREEPELRAPATSFDRFWVLEAPPRHPGGPPPIVGCVGLGLHGTAPAELKKLYLARELRGRGLGALLVATVEDEARRHGAGSIELWTDTRFTRAHALYRRLGYVPTGAQRELHDLSATVEDHYVKVLASGIH